MAAGRAVSDYQNSAFNPFTVGAGSIGAGLGSMFGGWSNPANAAQGPLNSIPGMITPYYNPYIQAGNQAIPQLEGQYGQLMNDPGGKINQIGAGYHQSPGFQFALQQALQGASHASNAGGMGGSPQDQQQQMGLATNLANQDYNTWLQNALGAYGQGLQGEQNLYAGGYGASNELAQSLANNAQSQGYLNYAGQMAQNQHQGGMWGSLIGGGASILSSFL